MARPLARVGDLSLGRRDLGRDRLVLGSDRPDVVELVDQIREARRGEDDRERVRVARLVDGDETNVESAQRGPVLPPEKLEPARLESEELGQLGELLLVQSEVALERVEARRGRPDLALERPDLRRHRRDLAGEDALLGLCARDLLVEPRDPVVDLSLP